MSNSADSLMSYLRTVSSSWRNDPRDDAELLARFAETRNEMAFATLVGRHGALVWRTCRSILGNTSDAEDAFQTTFLAMSRKVGQISIANLAGWLHKVARRTALNAQVVARRRQKQEQELRDNPRPESKEEAGQTELYAAMDEELAGLPERLRVPLLLRYLEGKTLEEVARTLGCCRRVLGKRLAKGEAILRERMERRGLTFGAVSVAALLGGASAAPAMPARLIESTAHAAVAFQCGTLANGVAESARKLLRTLAMEKVVRRFWWMVILCIGSFGFAGTGAVVWKKIGDASNTSDRLLKPLSSEIPAGIRDSEIKIKRSCRVDIHGDPLPDGALARLGTVRLRNTKIGMVPVAFTPDGKTLIALSDNRVSIWEFPSGRPMRKVDAQGEVSWDACNLFAVSADKKRIAIRLNRGENSNYEEVVIIDLSLGNKMGLLKVESSEEIRSIAFHPDGKSLILCVRSSVQIWDPETGRELRQVKFNLPAPKQGIDKIALTRNGKTIAIAQSNGQIRLLDLETGATKGGISIAAPKGVFGGINNLFYTEDDGKLVVGFVEKLEIEKGDQVLNNLCAVWDISKGKLLHTIRCKAGLAESCACFSPDNNMMAVLGENGRQEVCLIDMKTGRQIRSFTDNISQITYKLLFSPDGKTLISGGNTQSLNSWNVSTGRPTRERAGHECMVDSLAYSPDGKYLVSANGVAPYSENPQTPILIWDVKTCKPCEQQVEHRKGERLSGNFDAFEKHGNLAYSGDGAVLASVGSDEKQRPVVWLWDAKTGKRIKALEGIDKLIGDVEFVSLAPDSNTLAIGNTKSNDVALCDLATGKKVQTLGAGDLQFEGDRGSVVGLAFSPDGRILASIHQTGVAIWDTTIWNFHFLKSPIQAVNDLAGKTCGTTISAIAFSHDGKMLVAGGNTDKAIRLWEVASAKERLKILSNNKDNQIAISPDGKVIASAGSDENIRLWDAFSGKQIHQFPAGQGRIRSLAFAPDSKTLASANEDTTILIWSIADFIEKADSLSRGSKEEIPTLWSALADENAATAYQAITRLVSASDETAHFMANRMGSLKPSELNFNQLTQLLVEMDSNDFSVRHQARKKLSELGSESEPFLRQALQGQLSEEVRKSVKELSKEWINKKETSTQYLQSLRAIEVLERIGTPSAREVLQKIGDPMRIDAVACEARAALMRINRHFR